jgi:hypothetical protein
MAASQIKRGWAWVVAIFLMIMIGLSRLYLAVHFPHDVLLGWTLGLLILWAFVRWWDPVAAWAARKSLGQQVGLAFAASLLMLVLGALAFGTLRGWTPPAAWLENVRLAGVDELPAPVTLNSTITFSAVLFGMLAGLGWMNSRGGFSSDGSFGQRVGRFLLGITGVLVLYLGLKAIFPGGNELLPYVLRYLRYALIGLWISAGAPWVFIKLKLAREMKSV